MVLCSDSERVYTEVTSECIRPSLPPSGYLSWVHPCWWSMRCARELVLTSASPPRYSPGDRPHPFIPYGLVGVLLPYTRLPLGRTRPALITAPRRILPRDRGAKTRSWRVTARR